MKSGFLRRLILMNSKRYLAAGFILLFLLLSFSDILFNDYLSPLGRLFLKNIYSTICHQNSEKLICSDVFCSYLCARCTGIYAGVFIGLFAYRFFKIKITLRSFVLLNVPLLADVLAVTTGIYSYSHIFAFITGLLSGTVLILYISDIFLKKLRKNIEE